MNQKLTFTAFLQDEYSKKFDKLADRTDADIKQIEKDLSKFAQTGKRAAMSINDLNKRIEVLTRVKKMSIDTTAIRFASKEIEALKKQKQQLEGIGMNSSSSGNYGGMGSGLAIAGGATALLYMAKNGIQSAIEASMEREQQRISMGVLLGSQGKGDAMLQDIVQMAAKTPMTTNDLLKSNQTMLGFGVDPAQTLKYMRQLGDITGGNTDRFQAMTLAFSQMYSTGRLMGQDLLQMVNAGFNPLKIISEQTGKSMKELKKDMEDGNISVEMVTKAMEKATGVGGMFHGMMDKQSQTTAGRLSTLRDNANMLAVAIGDNLKPTFDAGIDGLSSFIATIQRWVEIPTSQKLKDETDKLITLRTELGFTNTTEQRRKEILEEVKRIQPDIIDNTKSEKRQLDELSGSLDSYIEKRRQQIALEVLKEQNIGAVTDYNDAITKNTGARAKELAAIGQATKYGFNADGYATQGQASAAAQIFLKNRIASGLAKKYSVTTTGSGMGYGGQTLNGTEEGDVLSMLTHAVKESNEAIGVMNKNQADFNAYNRAQDSIKKLLGGNTAGGKKPDPNGGDGLTDDKGGKGKGTSVPSISGSSKITHLTINIDSLIKGGVNIHRATVQDGVAEMRNVVTTELLTAVNDANLAAGKN